MNRRRLPFAAGLFAGLLLSLAAASAEPLPGQREAAEAGDARAAFAIAIHYDTGTPTNYPEALKWFRRSAEGGYPPGQAKLGLMYLYGWALRPDAAEAARWYGLAAEQGFVPAQAQVGRMAARGIGMPRDLVAAAMWTELAGKGGDAQAAWSLPRLQKKMSADEIARAAALAAAWRPSR